MQRKSTIKVRYRMEYTSVSVVNALVSSQIESYHSLFALLTLLEFKREQHVQNLLCKIITYKSFHISPQLDNFIGS